MHYKKIIAISMLTIFSFPVNVLATSEILISSQNIGLSIESEYQSNFISSFNNDTNNPINKLNNIMVNNDYPYQNLGITLKEIYIYNDRKETQIVGVLPENGIFNIIDNNEYENELEKFLEKIPKYYYIESGEYKGYIKSDDILTEIEAHNYYDETLLHGVLTKDSYLRLTKEENSQIIKTIPVNSKIKIIENNGDYLQVEYEDTIGYIINDNIKIKNFHNAYKYEDPIIKLRNDIISFAKQHIGNKYVWGGVSLTNGADCSGFVQSVYKQFGYELNRTAAMQSLNGYEVDYKDLQPGDLVFYGQSTEITHVAIYIGDNQIIHASNSNPYPIGGIKISSVNSNNIICTRRIIK